MALFSGEIFVLTVIFGLLAYRYVVNPRKTVKVLGIGYGHSPCFGPWRGAVGFMMRPRKYLWKGYTKYKKSYFKISTLREEYVMVSDKDKIAEYLAAPEDILSFIDVGTDVSQTPFEMVRYVDPLNLYSQEVQSVWTISNNPPWHRSLISGKLTQSIGNNVPDMFKEINSALDAYIGSAPEWTEVQAWGIISKVVIRAISQAFAGFPLYKASLITAKTAACLLFLGRNEKYLENAIAFTTSVAISAEMIRLFPTWLKPYAIRLTPSWRRRKLAEEYMKDEVIKRLRVSHKTKDKPSDLLQWIVDASPDRERTVKDIAERIMGLNVAAINTTTASLTSALGLLAAHSDEFVPLLRHEILTNSENLHITQKTMVEAAKLDSFLRESGRMNLISMIGLMRVARKDFRFKDGTVIPAGMRIGVPAVSIHHDPLIYPEPENFDGLRFAGLSHGGADSTKYQLAVTDIDYLTFGHGKHACPGRFFAIGLMKLVLAALVMRYDIKLAPGAKPRQRYFGKYTIPEFYLRILVKNRVTK